MQEINNAKISMSLGGEQKTEMSPGHPPWVRASEDRQLDEMPRGPPSQKVPESSSPLECGSPGRIRSVILRD